MKEYLGKLSPASCSWLHQYRDNPQLKWWLSDKIAQLYNKRPFAYLALNGHDLRAENVRYISPDRSRYSEGSVSYERLGQLEGAFVKVELESLQK